MVVSCRTPVHVSAVEGQVAQTGNSGDGELLHQGAGHIILVDEVGSPAGGVVVGAVKLRAGITRGSAGQGSIEAELQIPDGFDDAAGGGSSDPGWDSQPLPSGINRPIHRASVTAMALIGCQMLAADAPDQGAAAGIADIHIYIHRICRYTPLPDS